MSRFLLTLIITAAALAASAAVLDGPARRGAAVAILLAFAILFTAGVSSIRLGFFVPALCRLPAGAKRVALTFDDGPDPHTTPALLELLSREAVPASFFCIGSRVLARPDLVQRMAEEGHLVGNHSFDHGWWTNFLFGSRLDDQLLRTQAAIREATGRQPLHYRSPMGLTNPHLAAALRRTGLALVGWEVRSFDRRPASAAQVVERVVQRVRDGSIVALHDGGVRRETLLAIAGGLIQALRAGGYRFVRLDDAPEIGESAEASRAKQA